MLINSMKNFNANKEGEKIQHLVFLFFLAGFTEVLKHAGHLFLALIRISYVLIWNAKLTIISPHDLQPCSVHSSPFSPASSESTDLKAFSLWSETAKFLTKLMIWGSWGILNPFLFPHEWLPNVSGISVAVCIISSLQLGHSAPLACPAARHSGGSPVRFSTRFPNPHNWDSLLPYILGNGIWRGI